MHISFDILSLCISVESEKSIVIISIRQHEFAMQRLIIYSCRKEILRYICMIIYSIKIYLVVIDSSSLV
jgi:hypothetical protein